jgi:hypothetical protein
MRLSGGQICAAGFEATEVQIYQSDLLDTVVSLCYICTVFHWKVICRLKLSREGSFGRGIRVRRVQFADLQSAGSIWPREDSLQDEESGFTGMSATQGSLHEGVYIDAQEAELGTAKSCACSANQWDRGHDLYPGNRAQSAGTLHRVDPRWTCQGPPWGSLPCRAWNPGFGWSPGSQELTLQIWCQAAEKLTTPFNQRF